MDVQGLPIRRPGYLPVPARVPSQRLLPQNWRQLGVRLARASRQCKGLATAVERVSNAVDIKGLLVAMRSSAYPARLVLRRSISGLSPAGLAQFRCRVHTHGSKLAMPRTLSPLTGRRLESERLFAASTFLRAPTGRRFESERLLSSEGCPRGPQPLALESPT